jgi:hypothetical protein
MAMKLVLRPFYVYDPNVSDSLGGLAVKEDDDGNKFVLATDQMVQYWKDQGLLGDKKVGEVSDNQKKFLKQITRGRSEDNDANPRRIPKYSKAQSGAPGFAGMPSPVKQKKLALERSKSKKGDKAEAKSTTPKSTPAADSRFS